MVIELMKKIYIHTLKVALNQSVMVIVMQLVRVQQLHVQDTHLNQQQQLHRQQQQQRAWTAVSSFSASVIPFSGTPMSFLP